MVLFKGWHVLQMRVVTTVITYNIIVVNIKNVAFQSLFLLFIIPRFGLKQTNSDVYYYY